MAQVSTRLLERVFDVAIVGGGASGVLVAAQLLRNAKRAMSILLVEWRPEVARGVAYSTVSNLHVLNVPAAKMSAYPDDAEHFVHWLKSHPVASWNGNPGAFIERKIYGQYLADVLAQAQSAAQPGVTLTVLCDEVVGLDGEESPHGLHLASGRVLSARKIVLAVGNFAPANPRVRDDKFYRSPRYIGYAWAPDALAEVGRDNAVALIGSGLTMVDTVATLHERQHLGVIYVISRHGHLPQRHAASKPRAPFLQPKPDIRPLDLFRRVRHEVEAAGGDWRSVIDAIRPQSQALWQSLGLAGRRQFLRHLRPLWEIHRHRVSPQLADLLEAKVKSHAVQVIAGRLIGFREDDRGVEVMVRARRSNKTVNVRAQTVVNCTGPEADYRKLGHPLIDRLFEHGLARPDRLSMGLDTAASGALLNAWSEESKSLFTLGSPRKGNLWETTAIPELRVQAASLAALLLASR